MKNSKSLYILLTLLLLLITNLLSAQEETGLAGDHFSLDGALEVFEGAKDLEAFEKKINSNNNKVNNLDLNKDGEVDYVKVIDNIDGDAHAIVLQVDLTDKESQDIAVIEIEKVNDEEAILQIIGNADIYGEEIIIEPYAEEEGENKGGPSYGDDWGITVNVWFWSPVRTIYAPGYRRYVSPWRYAYYPRWYRPWRPLTWAAWHPVRFFFPRRYRVAPVHRVTVAHRVYTPVRRSSVVVKTRTTKTLTVNGNRTVVRNYNNTKVVATNGNKTVVKNKNTGRVAATNGEKKMVANKNTGKIAATNGEKKMVANKEKGKVAMSNGEKKVVANRESSKVAATNGKKTKVTSSSKAKKKVGNKAKKTDRKAKKATKKKKNG